MPLFIFFGLLFPTDPSLLTVPQVVVPTYDFTSTSSTRAYIEQRAFEIGVSTTTAVAIADCESDFIQTAKSQKSTASGVYQFLAGTWSHYGTKLWGAASTTKDVFNARDNIELALFVLKTVGTKDWEADPASEKCWSK